MGDSPGRLTGWRAVGGSIELSTGQAGDLLRIAAQLPAGTQVFLPDTPQRTFHALLTAARAAADVGLKPVPHLAVRRLPSRDEAVARLRALRDASGTTTVFLIAGDVGKPEGPFSSVHDLLQAGVLAESGMRTVGFAGFPTGHPHQTGDEAWRSLADKCRLAGAQGLSPFVVTQFGFDADAVAGFAWRAAVEVPHVPLRIGVSGPTNAAKLLRFALRCGVITAARAATSLGGTTMALATGFSPDRLAADVASRLQDATRHHVQGFHVFAFGALADTIQWLQRHGRIHGGAFELRV